MGADAQEFQPSPKCRAAHLECDSNSDANSDAVSLRLDQLCNDCTIGQETTVCNDAFHAGTFHDLQVAENPGLPLSSPYEGKASSGGATPRRVACEQTKDNL